MADVAVTRGVDKPYAMCCRRRWAYMHGGEGDDQSPVVSALHATDDVRCTALGVQPCSARVLQSERASESSSSALRVWKPGSLTSILVTMCRRDST